MKVGGAAYTRVRLIHEFLRYSLQSPIQRKQYITEILVKVNKTENNIPIKFQVDTGASCSTITLKDYKKITYEMPEKSNVKFKLYDQSLIQPIGSTKLYCTANGVRKKVHLLNMHPLLYFQEEPLKP